MRALIIACCLALSACAAMEPQDRYGISWTLDHKPLPAVFASVSDEAYFRICQQPIRNEDQSCAVREYVFRRECTIYMRSAWRYADPEGVRQHELKHCAGYSHPETYRGDIAAILRSAR